MRKQKMVSIFAVIMMIFTSMTCYAQSSLPQQETQTDWTIRHYTDGNGNPIEDFYLVAAAAGTAVAEDGSTAAAYMQMYVDANGFSFALLPDGMENFMYNSTSEDFTNPVYVSLDMGIETEATMILPVNSSEIFFDSSESVGGMSIGELIIAEMRQYGTVNLQIPFLGWGGRTDGVMTMLSFYLPQDQSNFHDMILAAENAGWREAVAGSNSGSSTNAYEGSSAAGGTSAYTNEEIVKVCTDYVEKYQAVLPYAEQLYENFENDNYGWAAINTFAALTPLSEFLEAKTAFDGIVNEKMSADQQKYYADCKNAINATSLGQIIQVLEALHELGLL